VRIALCFTHFHWDHIFGLPFFDPLYTPGNEVHIYGPADTSDSLTHKIQAEMGGDYFPVSTEAFRAYVKIVAILEQRFESLGVSISAIYAFHPGRTLAYRVDLDGASFVYAPDNEILPECVTPDLTGEALRLAHFASGASVLLHDCQYTRSVYETRRSWGHSCTECLAAVAAHAQVGRVVLFHHDPDADDGEVETVHEEFQTALAACGADIPSEPAREGAVLQLLSGEPDRED
jgi:phosphoribosyl 1,2-cyclic phosphodiesterase